MHATAFVFDLLFKIVKSLFIHFGIARREGKDFTISLISEMFGGKACGLFVIGYHALNRKTVFGEAEVDEWDLMGFEVGQCFGAFKEGNAAIAFPVFKEPHVIYGIFWAV